MKIRFASRWYAVNSSALVLTLALALPASAAILNVGPGGSAAGCEASNVESAVALAAATSAADEIRVVNTQVFTLSAGLHLTNWSAGNHGALTISGGWSSCTDSSAGTIRSQIRFTGSPPVIEIDTTAGGSSEVTLKTITLSGSTGRGLLVEGNSTVDLLRVLVENNDAGGLRVDSGASVYLDRFSTIQVNGPTVEGGALRCSGADTDVTSEATMRDNQAEFGGAIYATSGCEVLLDQYSSLMENVADGPRAGDGGAIYADGGALVSSLAPITIVSNIAAGSGGGIAAWGDGTLVLLVGTSLHRNEAGVGGGALYAAQGGQIAIGGGRCGNAFCPALLTENRVAAGGDDGSAALALDGGVIQLSRAEARGNSLSESEPHGSVFEAYGVGSAIRTESVVVAGNTGADRVFEAGAGGLVRVAFTTAARNRYLNAGGGLSEALALYVYGSGSDARSYTSIFHPTAGFYVGPEVSSYQFDCLIVQTRSGLPAAASETYVLDPGYLDLANGDLRVNDMSPAVDFCDSFYFPPTTTAVDGRLRNHDHPDNPNASPGPLGSTSIQDAGAYEVWELLEDGFETGNTSRWDAVEP